MWLKATKSGAVWKCESFSNILPSPQGMGNQGSHDTNFKGSRIQGARLQLHWKHTAVFTQKPFYGFLPIFPDLPLTGSDSKRTALLWGKPTMYLRKFSYLIIWGVFYQSARKMSALQGIKMCALISFLLCLLLHQEMGAAIRSEEFSSCHSHQKFNRLNPDQSSDQAVPELSNTLKLSCTGAEFKNVFCGVASCSDRASGTKLIQRRKRTQPKQTLLFHLVHQSTANLR